MITKEKNERKWVQDFLKIWISIVTGGLTAVYIDRKYQVLNFSNITPNQWSDIAGQSLILLVGMLVFVGIVYVCWKVFVNSFLILIEFVFSPIKALFSLFKRETTSSQTVNKEVDEGEKGFLDIYYTPIKNLINLILSVIIIFIFFVFRYKNTVINLGLEKTIIWYLVSICYSIFYMFYILFKGLDG